MEHYTPAETLERLANDKNPYVRWLVAKSDSTPPETLIRLANDEDSYVRQGLADNPNTPQYIKQYIKINRTLSKLSSLITNGSYP